MLNGQAVVIVFFVLSGFLITTLALREEERYGTFNFRAFIIRRSFRLFPVYYAVLVLYWIISIRHGRLELRKSFIFSGHLSRSLFPPNRVNVGCGRSLALYL
jgi:peptidoglycan/LPS O-acetylase OafA/YrhL